MQREFAEVKFVKAFNSVGAPLMINPQLEGGPPTMFICENDGAAKRSVSRILDEFGWEVADTGGAKWRAPLDSRVPDAQDQIAIRRGD